MCQRYIGIIKDAEEKPYGPGCLRERMPDADRMTIFISVVRKLV